jgi:hypothetical protein
VTDFDWLSPGVVEAATDGIRAEARRWYDFADRMTGVAYSMADMTLSPPAFAVIDVSGAVTAADQHGAYTATRAAVLRDLILVRAATCGCVDAGMRTAIA